MLLFHQTNTRNISKSSHIIILDVCLCLCVQWGGGKVEGVGGHVFYSTFAKKFWYLKKFCCLCENKSVRNQIFVTLRADILARRILFHLLKTFKIPNSVKIFILSIFSILHVFSQKWSSFFKNSVFEEIYRHNRFVSAQFHFVIWRSNQEH